MPAPSPREFMMRKALLQCFTSTLIHAGRTWRRAADEVVKAHGLSEATALPLLYIGRLGGEPRQTALADAIGIEGATLVRLLDQLCAANLAVRQEDPTDRRAKVLRLTDRGAEIVAAIEADFAELRERVFAGLSNDDVQASLRVFRAMQESVGVGRGPIALSDRIEETV